MSICPKNKSSKARRDKRRANWKMTAPALVKCSKCGELMMLIEYVKTVLLQQKRNHPSGLILTGNRKIKSGTMSFLLVFFVSAEKVIIISQITGCIIGVNRIKW